MKVFPSSGDLEYLTRDAPEIFLDISGGHSENLPTDPSRRKISMLVATNS